MVNGKDDLLRLAGFIVSDQTLKNVPAEAEKSKDLTKSNPYR